MKKFNRIGFKLALFIILGILIPVVILLGSYLFSINQMSNTIQSYIAEQLLLEVKNSIQHSVESVVSTMEAVYSEEIQHSTEEVVLESIKHKLGESRYGKAGYFFVYQYDGIRLVAPENRAQEGKNLWDLTDKNGKKPVQEFIKTAQNGGGFVSYIWLNPQTNRDEDKISYVSPLKLGNREILVGTGTYLPMIELAKAEIVKKINNEKQNSLILNSLISLMVLGVIVVILYRFLARSVITPIKLLSDNADKLARGDLDVTINFRSNDELGAMMRSFERMIENIQSQAKAAERIAAGDLEVELHEKSDKDILTKSMNQVVYTFQSLVTEVTMLTQAAVEGRLNTRGDTHKFNGGYQDIVIGINQTLDAVIEPIKEASTVLQEMAKGNIQVSVNGKYQGDHAEIKNTLNLTIETIQSYIGDIAYILTEMSKGNLNIGIAREYRGDFIEIKNSLNEVVRSFNDVMSELNNAADQVAVGAAQVSQSSQALSQGSAEQASTVEEITASVTEIATQTKQNAGNANQANELALSAKENAEAGNDQMKAMLKSMDEINESSANISKIIKVIDEIAFQTNILALNAAVEAARAGQHGKGFAVVAEEVRNLAARSANAAKETTGMIEGSVRKVELGTKIAKDTATALDKIVAGVTRTSQLIGEIAIASNEQATGITQINQGISQVSQVTQSNTATAEQSAAASEELSGQAQVLKSMVGRFKIKEMEK